MSWFGLVRGEGQFCLDGVSVDLRLHTNSAVYQCFTRRPCTTRSVVRSVVFLSCVDNQRRSMNRTGYDWYSKRHALPPKFPYPQNAGGSAPSYSHDTVCTVAGNLETIGGVSSILPW